jgi:hypothetical protein
MVKAQQMAGLVLEELKPKRWILRLGPDFVQDYVEVAADISAITGRWVDECDHPVELVEGNAVCHRLLPNQWVNTLPCRVELTLISGKCSPREERDLQL